MRIRQLSIGSRVFTSILVSSILVGLDVRSVCSEEPDSGNLRTFLELARKDVRTEKALLLAANMDFTNDEAVDFWPVYNEYELELSKWYDRRLELIKSFASGAGTLTDSQAEKLAADAFKLEDARTDLKRKYFKKFSKVVGAKKTARFFQVENQINAAVELRVAAALPLIK